MNAQIIAGLVIALGPSALEFIPKLAAIWGKGPLTAEEVVALCAPAKKSYDQYIVEARTRMAALAPTHARS